MRRRTFLHHAPLLAAGATAMPRALAMSLPPRFPMGYQLFSVRDAVAADALGTLRALVAMGYAHFESYGYDAEADRLYGYAPAELRGHLDDLGVRMTSGHFGFADYLDRPDDELRDYTDRCLACAEALGQHYLVWPIVPQAYRTPEGFRRLAAKLNVVGEQVRGSGVGFAWHNNGGEFDPLAGGTSGYELVLAEADPDLVELQLDLYWLAHDTTDLTPADLVEQHPGRYVLWHVKDMHPESRDYTELGAGTIDWEAWLPDAGAAGLEYLYLEQGGNYATGPLESAGVNARWWLERGSGFGGFGD